MHSVFFPTLPTLSRVSIIADANTLDAMCRALRGTDCICIEVVLNATTRRGPDDFQQYVAVKGFHASRSLRFKLKRCGAYKRKIHNQ